MNPELLCRVQRYPIFFAGMGAATTLALAAVLALGGEYALWRRAGRALERSQRELAAASAAANGAAVVEAETLRIERGRVLAEVFGNAAGGEAAPPMPTGRLEAYADLAAFVERQRTRAAQAGVIVTADERFGFGRYAREGPALESVAVVWGQRIGVEPLLEALWVARPRSLAGVWCGEEAVARAPPRPSLGVPGLVDSIPCRLAFVGDTGCLRRYLPALAGLARPVVVREVRAESVLADERRSGGPSGTRFTLMLELLSPTVALGAVGGAVALVPLWPAPRVQSTGADWCFEVFDSPRIEYSRERHGWALAGGEAGLAARRDGELELVEVRRLPYRWRLVGHGGRTVDDHGWVVLEDTWAGRTVRLRQGERDEKGAISVAQWRLVRAPGGEQVAEAKLLGPDAEERWLRAGVPSPGAELAVVLREGGSGSRVEGVAGATVRVGANDYRIGEIGEMPASVVLIRLGEQAETAGTLRLELTAR
ncbi:MAG: hypothetical protein IPL39_05040 [Opitutaceae bacterium]|nr:hypothetical protein [Opitutaceae bacterium]